MSTSTKRSTTIDPRLPPPAIPYWAKVNFSKTENKSVLKQYNFSTIVTIETTIAPRVIISKNTTISPKINFSNKNQIVILLISLLTIMILLFGITLLVYHLKFKKLSENRRRRRNFVELNAIADNISNEEMVEIDLND